MGGLSGLVGASERRRLEAAAERAHEVDRNRKLARLQVGLQAALLENRRLGAQYLQVIAEALAVAREREGVRVLRGRERLPLLDALRLHAAERREPVGHVAQRVGERLVVLLDRDVVLRPAPGEAGAQPSAVEERQAERRPGGDAAARRGKQPRF